MLHILWLCILLFGCASPTRDSTIVINGAVEPTSFDPHRALDLHTQLFLTPFFRGIAYRTPDGTAHPDAIAWYRCDRLKKHWWFKLQPHSWSSGAPVTAHDYVRSWQRVLSGASIAPPHALFFLKNGAQFYAKKCGWDAVGVHVYDDYFLSLELAYPLPNLFDHMASLTLMPTPPVTNWTNGAAQLLDWSPQNSLDIQISQQKYRFVFIDEPRSQLHLFDQKKIDLCGDPWCSISREDRIRLQCHPNYFEFHTKHIQLYWLNCAKVPLALRQALAYGINSLALSDWNCYQWRPVEHFFQRPLRYPFAEKVVCNQPLVMVCDNSAERVMQANIVQKHLSKVTGIPIVLRPLPRAERLQALRQGDFDLGEMLWVPSNHDPLAFFELFDRDWEHSNFSRWNHPTYRMWLQHARLHPFESTAKEHLHAIWVEQVPALITAQPRFALLSRYGPLAIDSLGVFYLQSLTSGS